MSALTVRAKPFSPLLNAEASSSRIFAASLFLYKFANVVMTSLLSKSIVATEPVYFLLSKKPSLITTLSIFDEYKFCFFCSFKYALKSVLIV